MATPMNYQVLIAGVPDIRPRRTITQARETAKDMTRQYGQEAVIQILVHDCWQNLEVVRVEGANGS